MSPSQPKLNEPEAVRFATGFVYRRNLIYVIGFLAELDAQQVDHAVVLRFLDGEWTYWSVDVPVVGVGAFDTLAGRTVFVLGIDGSVEVSDSMGSRWEAVATDADAPNRLRHVCELRRIRTGLYVAGMARQVYRRDFTGGVWSRVDGGVLVPNSSLEIAGFRSIDGFSEDDLYAVGFYGQIWHYDGKVWSQECSPTNLKLESVKAVSPDLVYISGNAGLLIRGHHDRWEVIPNNATTRTIWHLEYFQDQLYMATEDRILRLDNDEIVPIDIAPGRHVSSYALHTDNDVLLSVGSKDLYLFDGSEWAEIPHPPTR